MLQMEEKGILELILKRIHSCKARILSPDGKK